MTTSGFFFEGEDGDGLEGFAVGFAPLHVDAGPFLVGQGEDGGCRAVVPGDVRGEPHVFPPSGFPVVEEALAGLSGDAGGEVGSGDNVEVGVAEARGPDVVLLFVGDGNLMGGLGGG
jgi:hypothetical protein